MIGRPRLLARALRTRTLVIHAPSGFGKTTLAAQLAAELEVATATISLDGDDGDDGDVGDDGGSAGPEGLIGAFVESLNRNGLSDLAAAISGIPVADVVASLAHAAAVWDHDLLVVVDEVHGLDDDGAALLAALAAALPAWRWLFVGWSVPAALRPAGRDGWGELTAADLRFGLIDVMDLLEAGAGPPGHGTPSPPREVAAQQILDLTGGWPVAVALAAHRRNGSEVSDGSADVREIVDRLVDDIVPATDRHGVRRLAAAPMLSPEVAAALGEADTFERLRSLGLPVPVRPDGWAALPDAVRSSLAPPVLERDMARDVAEIYATGGELTAAVRLLHSCGDPDGIADLVARRPWEELQQRGVAFVRTVVALTTGAGSAPHAAMYVQLATAVEHDDPDLARQLLAEAEHVADEAGRLRLLGERAVAAAHGRRLDTATELATEVIDRGRPGTVAVARALYARGLAGATRATPSAISRARVDLEEAATTAELLGEYRWSSDALTRLGFSVHYQSGDVDLGIGVIKRALALIPGADRGRAVQLTYLAEVLDVAGQVAAATDACEEAFDIGRRLGDLRVVGYACWSAAIVAAHQGDHARAVVWLEEGMRHQGPWLDDAQGAGFHLAATQILTSLGDETGAARELATATATFQRLDLPDGVAPVIAGFEAAFGDPHRAEELLAALHDRPFAFGHHHWRRQLQRALAAHRRGDAATAASMLASARDEVARMGYPDLLGRHEAWAIAQLGAAGLNTASSGGSSAGALAGAVEIRLLGGFAVLVNGVDRTPATGNPATLVKLLALRGTMSADEVVEALWPDTDSETGRARLRNTRSRIRSQSGDIVLRRGVSLSLAPDAQVDIERFDAAYTETLAADARQRPGLARAALSVWRGELLPGDRSAEWRDAPSTRLRIRALTLLDLLATDAEERGDIDEALRQLDAAIAIDPYDDRRYGRAAALMVSQGRRSAARSMLHAALVVCADLGVDPDELVDSLAGDLGVDR